MSPRLPPLLQTGIRDKIGHRPFDLVPRRRGEHAVAMREIHRLKILEEPIKEGAEPEFRNSVEIIERVQAPQKNDAKFAAVVKRPGQLAPLHSERIDR